VVLMLLPFNQSTVLNTLVPVISMIPMLLKVVWLYLS
jgi:hypothetical protein